MERVLLLRYGEIFLKSEPVRKIYEKKLIENIKEFFRKKGIKAKISKERGRIYVYTDQQEKAIEILKNIFGIVSISPAILIKTSNLKDIKRFCKKNYKNWIKEGQSFAVRVKRVGKHNYTSQELAKAIGDVIERKVNLKNPDVEVNVEVRGNTTYIYTEKIQGLSGLPVSTSGKVISLISGGIDSPVASWLMMKRGCKVVFVHFHSFPLISKRSIEKVKELAKILSEYQMKSKIYFVPFSKIQMEIKTKIPAKYRIILYRRLMLKIAEEIAKIENANALVTGDSLAQVSSQTLENLNTISKISNIQILRPLIGMDKIEIIKLAKSIGTYKISIKPQEDCCTLFVPKHPATRSNIEKIERFEKALNIKKLLKNALKNLEVLTIT